MSKCLLAMLVLVLVLSIVGASAQFGGRGATGDGMIQITPKGYFALRDGILVKFDTKTLKALPPNELFGPAPKMPEGDMRQNGDAFRAWYTEIGKRSAPAIMLPKDDALIIIIGTNFFRVNQETLITDAKQSFAPPTDTTTATERGGWMAAPTTPAYQIDGNMIFLLMPKEMIVLDLKDGKLLGRTPLPESMFPREQNFNRGGGPGGGRGNQGGQRGGNDNANN